MLSVIATVNISQLEAAFNAMIGRKDVEAARDFARELGLDLAGLGAAIRSMDAVFGASA